MEAKEFYFQLIRQISGNVFLVTPILYYDKEGCLSDQSNIADKVMPKGFYELSESTYQYEGTPETGRELLISLGMKEIDFGLQPGEPSSENEDEDLDVEDEEHEYDEIDNLLYRNIEEPHPFDYKNVSTDKLIRHLSMMISTEAFEEAAKIKIELNSRGVTEFLT